MNKRVLIIISFVFLLLLSVSDVKAASSQTAVFMEDEFQFQSKSKGISIKIGSTREEVEEQLGYATNYYAHSDTYDYKDMVIHYKEGIVDAIMISRDSWFDWFNTYKTPSGIGLGSKLQKVIQQYGRGALMEPTDGGTVRMITYLMHKNAQGEYRVKSSFHYEETRKIYKDMNTIGMVVDDRGYVQFIMLATFEYAYRPDFE